jgi:nitrilase
MGDTYPTVRAAAVQASPVFLDREATVAKACDLIREAGSNGARIVAFPESFIPAHPIWFHFHPGTGRIATRLSVELFKNALEIPGPEVSELAKAARDAGAYVVVGVCEKLPNTIGTLFNTQVFLGPDGSYLGKHQKLMPTVGERLVHQGGYGDTLTAFQTDFGPVSGLICGENSNPLAVFALTAQNTRVHVASWPNHFPAASRGLRARMVVDSQAFAQMSKACVISAASTLDDAAISVLELSAEDEAFLRHPDTCGGSVIIGADSGIVAGPMGSEEGILYGDLNLELGIMMKLRHDFSGHYNRPDIFQFRVNRSVPALYAETGTTAAAQPAQDGAPPASVEWGEPQTPAVLPADRAGAQ